MKRVLTLISTVGIYSILTTGIFVSVPKSVSAYCINNLTGGFIRHNILNFDDTKYSDLPPEFKACCPPADRVCRNEFLIESMEGSKGEGKCKFRPGVTNYVVEVRYKDRRMACNKVLHDLQ